jgi:DNA-binding response OmpR family regulator
MVLPKTRLLLIEDNPADVHLLRDMLSEAISYKIELLHADCVGDALTRLADGAVNIVMLDLGLPDAQGLEAVRRIRQAAPVTPLIVLTGLDDESMAVRALHEGAQDYLVKGQIEPRGLLRALRSAA